MMDWPTAATIIVALIGGIVTVIGVIIAIVNKKTDNVKQEVSVTDLRIQQNEEQIKILHQKSDKLNNLLLDILRKM